MKWARVQMHFINLGNRFSLVRCVLNISLDNDLHDKAFLNDWVDNYEDYYKSLELFTMDFAEETTGIPKEQIISFGRLESMSICWAMGVTQQDIGSDTSTTISNLDR